MSTVTLKNVPEELVEALKDLAAAEDRSLNQQAIHLLRRGVSEARAQRTVSDVEWQLAQWKKLSTRFKQAGFPDPSEIRKARRSSRRKLGSW